jgi:S-adenosylmethionine synthetase
LVETYGTGKLTDEEIADVIHRNFDLRPGKLISQLNLKRPIYQKTAVFGHFGRSDPDFTWEIPRPLDLGEYAAKLNSS